MVLETGLTFPDRETGIQHVQSYATQEFFQVRASRKPPGGAVLLCSREGIPKDKSSSSVTQRNRLSQRCNCTFFVYLKPTGGITDPVVIATLRNHSHGCDPSLSQAFIAAQAKGTPVDMKILAQFEHFCRICPETKHQRKFLRINHLGHIFSSEAIRNLRVRVAYHRVLF